MDPTYLALAIVILLFSVIFHEVMHGFVALKFGDHTAEKAGRLTLNPLPHIDPFGTILVPLLFIIPSLLFPTGSRFILGWAKPVPVNPLNFSDIKKGEFLVSLAGPGSNFTLAALAAVFYHLMPTVNLLTALLAFTFTINLILGVFNLLPIPPLDGSKILLSQLPYKLALEYQKLEKYGMLILLFLWFVPIAGISILSLIMGLVIRTISQVLQVPPILF